MSNKAYKKMIIDARAERVIEKTIVKSSSLRPDQITSFIIHDLKNNGLKIVDKYD